MSQVDLVIADTALRQHGVFTREQAVAAGATRAMIRHRLASGRWGRLYARVFRMSGSPGSWDQVLFAAWLAAGRGAVVSHLAAADRWDMPSGRRVLELSVPGDRRLVLPSVRLHRASCLDAVDRVDRGGLLVTTPTRTVIDLCGELDRTDCERLLDHALTRRMTTPDHLRRRCAALGRRGRHAVVRLEAMLDARPAERRAPESEFERRLLALLARVGGPVPMPQHEVRLPGGRRVRLDVAWPEQKLALEADSYVHHSSLTDWSADHVRNAALTAVGWRILPITWTMLTEQPAWVVELVTTALHVDTAHVGSKAAV
jgi:hypothetical protein